MAGETNQIGGEYLRLFFNDVEQLNDFTATYKLVLVEVKIKSEVEDFSKSAAKMDTEEKKRLWFQAQTIRYLVTRIDLKLMALKEKIGEFKSLDFVSLRKLRDEIREAPIPDFVKVEEYTQEINKLFVMGIVSQFLEGSGQGYSSFVSNQNFDDGKTQ